MSRDLFPEIETLVSTANPYIRRKAALCAMRICRKVPDLQEHFVEKAAQLLSDRNHGVLLCGLTLVTSARQVCAFVVFVVSRQIVDTLLAHDRE